MCNIGEAITRAFGIGPSGAEQAQLTDAENAAQNSANTASGALTKAISDATAASLPAADNPSALAASRAQQQKLLAAQGAAWSFGNAPTAAPAVATKILFGV